MDAGGSYTLNDGLGTRRLVAHLGEWEEELELSPALCRDPAIDDAIRARAARWAELPKEWVAHVRGVERDGATVRVAADALTGLRLTDLLTYLESAPDSLSHSAMMALVMSVIDAVSVLHEWSRPLVHGALAPSHVVITHEGRTMVSDAVYGDAIEAMQLNRGQLWEGYGLMFPASANLPRCDQVSDVTQLGALVLAIALRRPLRVDEYPHGIPDLVSSTRMEATRTQGSSTSALHMWLQQALQLRQRATFSNAVQAKVAFEAVTAGQSVRRLGMQALSSFLQAALVGAEGQRIQEAGSSAEGHRVRSIRSMA